MRLIIRLFLTETVGSDAQIVLLGTCAVATRWLSKRNKHRRPM